MLRFIEVLLFRGVLWVGLPLLLAVLAIGPGRCWHMVKRGWNWLWQGRLEPEAVLGKVVKQYQDLVEGLNVTLTRSRDAQAELERHIVRSEENLATLEKEAAEAARRHDDLEAKAVLYKRNLEQNARTTFQEQLERQKKQIDELRKHVYLVELQLRQYEVGRSILLSQLAEAKTAEQQYAIANQFDPFSAVANWKEAENMVEAKQMTVRAAERVYTDLMEVPLPTSSTAGAPPADPEELEVQLRQLKERLSQADEAPTGFRPPTLLGG